MRVVINICWVSEVHHSELSVAPLRPDKSISRVPTRYTQHNKLSRHTSHVTCHTVMHPGNTRLTLDSGIWVIASHRASPHSALLHCCQPPLLWCNSSLPPGLCFMGRKLGQLVKGRQGKSNFNFLHDILCWSPVGETLRQAGGHGQWGAKSAGLHNKQGGTRGQDTQQNMAPPPTTLPPHAVCL